MYNKLKNGKIAIILFSFWFLELDRFCVYNSLANLTGNAQG